MFSAESEGIKLIFIADPEQTHYRNAKHLPGRVVSQLFMPTEDQELTDKEVETFAKEVSAQASLYNQFWSKVRKMESEGFQVEIVERAKKV